MTADLFGREPAGGVITPARQQLLPLLPRSPTDDVSPRRRDTAWREEARKTMRQITELLPSAPTDIGARWANALRARYGRDAAKLVAQDFNADLRTAQGWLAGQAPQVNTLARAALKHGPAIVFEVLLPDADPTEAELSRRLATMETTLADLRKQLEVRR